MVEPLTVKGRPALSQVEDRGWRARGRVPGAEPEAEAPNYRARLGSRRSSMRAHPSAQRQTDSGEPARS